MFQHTLANLHRTASSLGGLMFHRRTALRVAGMVALAGLLLTRASAPAEAHPAHGYTLDFIRLSVVTTTSEVSSDEPYLLFAVGNLATGELVVTRTSVFGDVDDGESRDQTVRLWGPSGVAAPLPGDTPDNLIVLVQPMEHDQCDVEKLRTREESWLRYKLGQYRSQGLSRDRIVTELATDMAITAQCSSETWWGTRDMPVGRPQELRITAADVATAHGGTAKAKRIVHDDGGVYQTSFRFQAAASVLQP